MTRCDHLILGDCEYCQVRQTVVTIPIKTTSAANLREHWRAKARRHRAEKAATSLALLSGAQELRGVGSVTSVTFTRLGVRLLDSDNLAGGFKAIRDEVADFLGVSDGPETGIAWLYEQERAKEYSARVTVRT
jgi:hypothetical protein